MIRYPVWITFPIGLVLITPVWIRVVVVLGLAVLLGAKVF